MFYLKYQEKDNRGNDKFEEIQVRMWWPDDNKRMISR